MATAFAASYTGAKIIPIDSELKTCNLNTNLLEKINNNTKILLWLFIWSSCGYGSSYENCKKI